MTIALKKHNELFHAYKVSHIDNQTGRVIRFADPKTRGTTFDINTFSMPYNPNRVSHVSVKEALIDPTVTINDPHKKPNRYDYVEVPIKNTFRHDIEAKEHIDYTGKSIHKIDTN